MVSTIEGQLALLQDAAGFSCPLLGSADEPSYRQVIELPHMHEIMTAGLLARREQIHFLRAVDEAMSGVETLHGKGYVHRDIKMENMIFSGKREGYLTDFGTAAEISDLEEKKRGVGSPFYMSPESAVLFSLGVNRPEAAAKITPATDVWSLGLTLWRDRVLEESRGASYHDSGANTLW